MTGHATVYVAEDGTCRVVPLDVTTVGLLTAREVAVVPRGSTDEELGSRAIDAIETAGRLVQHPQSQAEWSARTKTFVRAMATAVTASCERKFGRGRIWRRR